MREIKFRAWDKRRNSWFKEFWIDMFGGIYGIGDLPNNIFDKEKSYIPEHIVVNQYTGLKDKNGVEIYESDLLKHFDGELRIVAYDDNAALFALQRNDERRKFVSGLTDYEFYEVIGNIYENKDLLQ